VVSNLGGKTRQGAKRGLYKRKGCDSKSESTGKIVGTNT